LCVGQIQNHGYCARLRDGVGCACPTN
jgi:hypothetical protein